jgi:hypothetical protein
MITSARSAAFFRSSVGASATVTTIGGVTAAVNKGESRSSRHERDITATGTAKGPVVPCADGSGCDRHNLGL